MSSTYVRQIRACQFIYPKDHPEGPGSGELFVYLIRTDSGAYLVDTGIGAGHAWIDEHFRPKCSDLARELAQCGVALPDITAVICSHLHFDHCGNNMLFQGIPIYVQRAEYEAAHQARYTVPEWVDFPGVNYRLLDGSSSVEPCIEIISTPGHTCGHQSIGFVTGLGLELVVAQAAYTAEEFRSYGRDNPPVRDDAWSKTEYNASLRHLHSLRPVRAYFSHDSTVWRAET